MTIKAAAILAIIPILIISSLFYVSYLKEVEIRKFCEKRGFEGIEIGSENDYCLKIENETITKKKQIYIEINWVKALTFQNPVEKIYFEEIA